MTSSSRAADANTFSSMHIARDAWSTLLRGNHILCARSYMFVDGVGAKGGSQNTDLNFRSGVARGAPGELERSGRPLRVPYRCVFRFDLSRTSPSDVLSRNACTRPRVGTRDGLHAIDAALRENLAVDLDAIDAAPVRGRAGRPPRRRRDVCWRARLRLTS